MLTLNRHFFHTLAPLKRKCIVVTSRKKASKCENFQIRFVTRDICIRTLIYLFIQRTKIFLIQIIYANYHT